MINLTRGVPPIEAFPIEDLIVASDLSLRNDGRCTLQYVPSPGYLPLRDLLAQMNNVAPENVFMGNSSLELLHFLTMILIKPGMRAFAEAPSYDRANKLIKRAGANLVGIPLEIDGVDLNALEAELKKGAPVLFYIIADFQNPMGTATSLEKRQQIAAWAREYNFWIVEDSPYRALRYRGEPIPTLRELAPEHVIQTSSFSKVIAPGVRLGTLIAPTEIIKPLRNWVEDTYIAPITHTQGLLYEYLKAGKLAPNLVRLCNLYRPRLDAMLTALDEHFPGAVYPRPDGGFFIGVTLPEGNDIETLIPRAAEAGLKLSDGRGFFANPADGLRFLRLPFCSLTPDEINKAIETLDPLIVK